MNPLRGSRYPYGTYEFEGEEGGVLRRHPTLTRAIEIPFYFFGYRGRFTRMTLLTSYIPFEILHKMRSEKGTEEVQTYLARLTLKR